MGARVKLADDLATGGTSASTRIRVAKPPFVFSAIGTYATDPPLVQNSVDGGTTWETIATLTTSGDLVNWDYPLSLIRVSRAGGGTGTADVYMLEGIG